jgi:hypothetical protein
MICKKVISFTAALAFAGMVFTTSTAYAQSVTNGNVTFIFGEPNALVIQLSQSGMCGSQYFQLDRVKANYKDTMAIALTALATNKTMTLWVIGCVGDRNIISQGSIAR